MAISYTEKGSGLHDAIRAAGHRLERRDGVWISDDDVAVQAIIDSYSLTNAQDLICAQIEGFAANLRSKFVVNISPAEMASWPIKQAEASAYIMSGDPAKAPMLATEAAARGITLTALVTLVGNNAASLAYLEATIAGVSGKHRDAVRGLGTFSDVLSYDWHAGWPE